MVELLAEIEALGERISDIRERLPLDTEQRARQSRVQSVYGSLAIEDPSVTVEEVREVLSCEVTVG